MAPASRRRRCRQFATVSIFLPTSEHTRRGILPATYIYIVERRSIKLSSVMSGVVVVHSGRRQDAFGSGKSFGARQTVASRF